MLPTPLGRYQKLAVLLEEVIAEPCIEIRCLRARRFDEFLLLISGPVISERSRQECAQTLGGWLFAADGGDADDAVFVWEFQEFVTAGYPVACLV